MKRILTLWLALCLLASGLALPVTADEAVLTTGAFDTPVQYSVTDSNLAGFGLAFCFTLNAKIITKYESKNAIVVSNATLNYGGEDCKITRMGAVVTHLAGIATDDSRMVRATATGRTQMKDVRATKMYDATAAMCRYAIRVVNIPFEQENDLIYARPYVEIESEGEKITLYGQTVCASFADKLLECSMKLPFYGADIDGKKRITVGDTAVLCNTLYLELIDELDEWMTMGEPAGNSQTVEEALKKIDYIRYACYDAQGNELRLEDTWFGILEIPAMSSTNSIITFKIDLPEGTAEVKLLDAHIRYWTEWE